MISRIVSFSLFLAILLSVVARGSSGQSNIRHARLLPWEIITERFLEGDWFCGNNGLIKMNLQQSVSTAPAEIRPESSLCFKPGDSITFKFPETIELPGFPGAISVSIDKFSSNSWQKVAKVMLSGESGEVGLPKGIAEEGFFRLSFPVDSQHERPQDSFVYAIACNNWKKDALSFCRKLKEDIELNPDKELFRSCIAVSHFDHAMELISETPLLSDKVLGALNKAIRGKKDFERGKCPDLVVGLNKIRLKRFEGGLLEEFAVVVPDNYTPSKPWPVFVHADVRRLGANSNYSSPSGLIDLWWHTVSYKDLRWKNYMALMQIIEQRLNIDKDRMYVDGECRDGIDAIALALNYPDYWAECSVRLGNSYRHLAGNMLNLPLIFIKVRHEEPDLIAWYDFALKCFQYHCCRHLKWAKFQSTVSNKETLKFIEGVRGAPVPQTVREKSPLRVLYTIESLKNPKAYWVRIDGREDENLLGTVDALADGQTIQVRTHNVDAYCLDLGEAPVDSNEPVRIVENGKSLGFVTGLVFTKRSKKYSDATHTKHHLLHGPVWDVFTDPYVVVYRTVGTDTLFINACKSVAKDLAHGGPCLVDTNMPRKMITDRNLVLVGFAESNVWAAKILEKLPVRIKNAKVHMSNGMHFDGKDLGYVVIYPNPINLDRYVVVCSATSSRAMASMFDAYSQMRSIRPVDVGIYEVTDNGHIKWHILEKFNTVWGWHDDWDQVLITTNKKHAKWRWRQWIAKTIREKLEVDVVIYEDPFIFKDATLSEQITYRDMFNLLKNVWFTKVEIDGQSLREILTAPLASTSKREVDAPIIDGISVFQKSAGTEKKLLTIDKLANDVTYTVAMPEKCLNGNRLGIVLDDYEIIGQSYLLPVLREYLESHTDINLDDQLGSLKFKMY